MSDAAETILNVDDSEAIRYARSRVLRHAGFRVVEAATGADALRLAATERPALVVLDVHLPDASGLDVCRQIKQKFPATLVLQSSASFVEVEDRVRGLEVGADAYLTEPVAPPELVAAVRALLRLRRAERAAHESEARFRLMIDSATDYAILTLDLAGLVTSWSRGAERILEFAADEIIGRSAELIFTAEDRLAGRLAEEMREARETGRAPDERWMQRRSGEPFWAEGVMRPLHDAEGKLLGYLKVLRDATQRRRTEAALAESEARFRAITDTMPQIVWSAGADGRHDYYNRRWYDFIGLDPEECRGDEWTSLMHPDDRAAEGQQWQHALAAGSSHSAELRFRRGGDGAWRWFMVRALPVRDAAGRITRWFGTCTDVQDMVEARNVQARGRDELERLVADRTIELKHALNRLQHEMAERERTEAALRQSQKMEAIGQLTGGVAHDFNNLLTGISGSLELLQTRLAQGHTTDLNRYISAAMTSATRAAALTHRLLAFARRQALAPKPTSINRLVAGIEELIRRTVGPSVAVETVLAAGLWTTLCDTNQLESALLNLCINARDAMPHGGRLTIETANAYLDDAYTATEHDVRPGQYVALSVTDTGTGMAPEVLARAFEPFYTTKPLGEGTGLGLSMLYGFVKQSEGHVRIYSEVDQGTTVRLYLPRHRDSEVAASIAAVVPARPVATRGGTSGTVLVVEDEAVVRALILEVLADLGYAAIEAADGPAGLRILQSDARIDLLISDVGLPGLNGRQLAEAAREQRPELNVLFITGYAHNAAINNDLLADGMDMIAKPFALDALAAKVRAIIESNPGPPASAASD